MAAAAKAGRVSAIAMGGVVVMLLVAGLLEGFGRQLITDDLTRYGIGIAMLDRLAALFLSPPARGPDPWLSSPPSTARPWSGRGAAWSRRRASISRSASPTSGSRVGAFLMDWVIIVVTLIGLFLAARRR